MLLFKKIIDTYRITALISGALLILILTATLLLFLNLGTLLFGSIVGFISLLLFLFSKLLIKGKTPIVKQISHIIVLVYSAIFLFFILCSWIAIKKNIFNYCFLTTGALLKKIITHEGKKDVPLSHETLTINHLNLIKTMLFNDKAQPAAPQTITLMDFKVTYQTTMSLHSFFTEVFLHNVYFFKTNKLAPVIIDGGSNIGISILYFKKLYPQAKIIGFEPDPTTFKVLQKNMHQNNLKDVTIFPLALSDKVDLINFYTGDGPSYTASVFNYNNKRTAISIPCKPLSPYITTPIDLLKLDIEGAETQVILELAQTKKLNLVNEIIMEYHHHLDNNKDYLSQVLKTLEDYNFGYLIRSTDSKQPFIKNQIQYMVIYAYKKQS